MVALTITPLSESGAQVLPPDVEWSGQVGDFALSSDPADGGVGGLRARHPIQSAVAYALFTDGRAAPRELRFEMGGDLRGWPGDGVSLFAGDAAIGSKLWLYRRHELTDATGAAIAAEAKRALKPLLDEKLVVRVDVSAEVLKAEGQVRLKVDLYGRDGRKVYADQFDPLWRAAIGSIPAPVSPEAYLLGNDDALLLGNDGLPFFDLNP
jgi:phage gp46-like protein